MQKSKRPPPGKSHATPEEDEDAVAQNLCALAVELASLAQKKSRPELRERQQADMHKLIRNCLKHKDDDSLYEALERAGAADHQAYRLLKEAIEEAADILVIKRDAGPALEINAFAIPLFAHSRGGLHREQDFQDQEAFDLLTQSVQQAQLESPDAKVVLVSHAYHPDEIGRITYSRINDMLRDAFASMTAKKAVATPAIERSISGWPDSHFAANDVAVELRFLLGFALKRLDDPFYQVPTNEAAAERYFDARAARFQAWTRQAAPLVQRCLATDGSEIELHFLYQDLFHGAKETGLAEYALLEMMAALQQQLQAHGILPQQTRAFVGPIANDGETLLRVQLTVQESGTVAASFDHAFGAGAELQDETDDLCDALLTMGVPLLSLAARFDAEGRPIDVHPYQAASTG